jgi:hypothetical protein
MDHKLTYFVDHRGMSRYHVSPHYSHYGDSHMWTFNNILEGPKPYHKLRVEDVKTLTLDGYLAMLSTRPLGREGVPVL